MPFFTKGYNIYQNKLYYSNSIINKNVLSNHINNSTLNKLTNKNPSTDRLVYSSQNPYGSFTRNPSCWINGVNNISCFSPAQLSGFAWNKTAGTLITTKHILQAKHFNTAILPGGTTFVFVDSNNNVVYRKLIAYEYDPRIASNGTTQYTDIAVGLLDNDVPSNIKIAKVLPTNYGDYINYGLLAVALNQQEKAILKQWTGQYSNSYLGLTSYSTTLLNYNNFSEDIVTGDSGNPAFIIIDNELVLLSCFTSTIGGEFVTSRYDAINDAINRLSPNEGYSLTPIDLQAAYYKYS